MDQEPHGGLPVLERCGDVAGLLGDPGRIGVPGRSGNVHPPGAELEEDERVQRLQPDRLRSEEVNGDDSPRLLVEELPPRPPSSGSGPEAVRPEIVAMVVAETRIPRPRSSPWIRWYPHLGFSLAKRRTRLRVSGSMAGRPGRRRGFVHFRVTSRRCHRRRVSGQTRNERQAFRGRTLLAAARKALSEVR